MKNKSRALRHDTCVQTGGKVTGSCHKTCAGSLVTVVLQLKDTAGFVATLLHNASLPYHLGMIFKCKVSHLSFLGRFWRKETWKNRTIEKVLTLV